MAPSSYPSIKLKKGRKARVTQGHPWVYASEVVKLLPDSRNGEVVICRDSRGNYLGTGFYNGKSQIVWRRLTSDREEIDQEFVRKRIRQAIKRRSGNRVCRLVWSESDDLPGLVVDRYGKTLVVQLSTLGMDLRKEWIAEALEEALPGTSQVYRNDGAVRQLEGCDQLVEVLGDEEVVPGWVKIGACDYWLDLLHGQKTGYYLDQRVNHQRIAGYAEGKDVLDAFCNQGGVALNCAQAGASSVLGVDISEDAIDQARKNAERNALKIDWKVANVFDFLRENHSGSWNLICLDPPPFTKTKAGVADALRGYKELNLRAFRMLGSGGILATFTCSHHIDGRIFREMLAEAAADAGRRVRILEECGQPPDHPVLLNVPETEYLRGLVLEVL